MPPEQVERLTANALELLEALVASEAVHHALSQAERRRHGFGVAPENETEVDVEEVAGGFEHDVVQMAIPDAEDVRDDAVARAGLYVSLHDAGGRLVRVLRRGAGSIRIVNCEL